MLNAISSSPVPSSAVCDSRVEGPNPGFEVAPVEMLWREDLPIFASPDFLRLIASEYGWLGGTDESGCLRCVLPYTVIRKPWFRLIRFPTETIAVGGELQESEERPFLNSVLRHLAAKRIDLIVPPNNTALFRTYPEGALAAPYGTYVNDLEQPEDVLWSAISESYRKDIRRAIKQGVEIRSGVQYLETARDIIASTLSRSGMGFKKYKQFEKLVIGLGEHVKVFVALQGGIPQASLVTPFSGYSAHAWYGGTIPEPARGAMHLMHWEAIRSLRVAGVKRFNFTGVRINPDRGSKQEGIAVFKARFGGKLIAGHMWKYSFNPLKSAAYSLIVRGLMGGDVVDQEQKRQRRGTPAS